MKANIQSYKFFIYDEVWPFHNFDLYKKKYNTKTNSWAFLQYSECLANSPSLLYNSKINPFLNLMISANHVKGDKFQLIGKFLYTLLFLLCKISFLCFNNRKIKTYRITNTKLSFQFQWTASQLWLVNYSLFSWSIGRQKESKLEDCYLINK